MYTLSSVSAALLVMPGVLAEEDRSINLSTEMLNICDSLFYCIKAQFLSDITQSYFELFGNKRGFCACEDSRAGRNNGINSESGCL